MTTTLTADVNATLGMSIKKNVRLARDLGVLTIPDASLIDIEEVDRLEPGQVCIISTAQQASPKVIHISEPVRAQLISSSARATRKPLSFSSSPMAAK